MKLGIRNIKLGMVVFFAAVTMAFLFVGCTDYANEYKDDYEEAFAADDSLSSDSNGSNDVDPGSNGKESISSGKEANADGKEVDSGSSGNNADSNSSGENLDSGSSGTSGDSVDSGSANSGTGSSSSCATPISTTSVTTEYLNPEKNYGDLIDERDGQLYKTITIGDQTWMAQNLNFLYEKGTSHSFCFGDDPANCEKYGRLYTWSAALDSAGLYSEDGLGCGGGATCGYFPVLRGVCPEGWHVPSDKEFETLRSFVSSAGDLQALGFAEWSGATNTSGFSAIPSGLYTYNYGDNKADYYNLGEVARYWSRSEGASNPYALVIKSSQKLEGTNDTDDRLSVRCIKDTSPRLVVEYSTITDDRDGQVYRTVRIGNQTWMAQNLNFKNYPEGVIVPKDYDDKPLPELYGKLYTWDAAVDSAGLFSNDAKGCGYGNSCAKESDIRGLCPENWHLPDQTEWEELIAYAESIGGDGEVFQLQSRDSDIWDRATNRTGFSALPTGIYSSVSGLGNKSNTYYWSTTKVYRSGDNEEFKGVVSRIMIAANHYTWSDEHKDFGLSVRCIHD
ncbi:FISUMP domain-containing protein [Fibrobacter sp.]|uniref:FISUMP domain-containing protein n=1 Tax=Fibrobacter sp. TaxID=35828 RepID=UPI00388F4F46